MTTPRVTETVPDSIRLRQAVKSEHDVQRDRVRASILAVPGEPNTARAITFFGPTALLRGWKWDGKKWVE